MNIFNADKIMDRLEKMIDCAKDGKSVESVFDETKMSAIESKLNDYLAMTNTGKAKLESDRQKIDQLLSDISHQTKTPIANIMLYAQLLEESSLGNQEKDYISHLIAQTEKLNFLISSMINASRLESGIVSLQPKMEMVQSLLDNVKIQVESLANKKNIKLTWVNTDIKAKFDLKWTGEALFNIIDNAVKYTDKNGAILVTVIPYQFFVRIDIEDNGIGIEEGETAKIFTRFYRSSKVNDQEGVGIGLYLAREIIVGQGGYIKVESKLNYGSKFSVFLPMDG